MDTVEGFLVLFCMTILIVIVVLIYYVFRNRQIINDLDKHVNKYIDEDIIKLRNIIKAVNYNDEVLKKKHKFLTDIISQNNNFSYNKNENVIVDEENSLNIKEIDFSNNNWNIFDTVTAKSALDDLLID